MKKRTQQRFIAALLMVLLTACQTWRPTTVSPQAVIPVELPLFVRATLTSGEVKFFENPSVRNDSIVGTGSSLRVAWRDVSSLEVRRFSAGKTAGAVVLTAVGLFAVFLLIGCTEDRLC